MNLSLGDVELAVTSGGHGPLTLVFLHYWGGSQRTFLEVAGALEEEFRVVRYDHRGWGDSVARSGSATAVDYSIGALAHDAERLVSALGVERYVLVGHSMGGKVAQLVASRQPAGLTGLVLVAPSPAGGVNVPEAQRESMLHAYDDVASIEATIDGVLTARTLSATLRRRVIEDSLRGAAAAKAAWPSGAIAEDVSAGLAAIAVPTLVVGGELDKVDPIPVLEHEVVARIPGARLHVLAGTGHLSPLENPAELAATIAEFARAL